MLVLGIEIKSMYLGRAASVLLTAEPSLDPWLFSFFRDIPYLSKHRADRMKRLADFLNLESFDLALLQEVRLKGRPGWEKGSRGRWGPLSLRDEVQASILTFVLRCGVSRTSST